MRNDNSKLADVYDSIYKKAENKKEPVLTEDVKGKMTVGKHKGGEELEGEVKKVIKNSGPDAADGVEKAEEGPAGLNPVKKRQMEEKTVKDGLSFQQLYNQVITEEDIDSIEDTAYDDEMGDFPASEDEVLDDEEIAADMEPVTVTLTPEEVDVLRSIIAQVDGEDLELKDELDVEDDLGEEPVGEARSEPEPKPHSSNVKELQAPRKLAGKGVKKAGGKAQTSGGTKKRTGEIEDAPKGPTPGDKGMMKVSGTGAAHTAKNASLLEARKRRLAARKRRLAEARRRKGCK